MGITNTAKKNGFLVQNLRNFFEHRALWLYFIYDQARKTKSQPESFIPAAIRRCGIYHGMRALTGNDTAVKVVGGRGGSCRLLRKKLFPAAGRGIFEMQFLALSDDAFDVDFYYCPLVNAWQKQGCSDKQIEMLCDWAMEGDRGIAEAFGCELELKKTIAKGDGVCQIRIKRK